MTEWIITSSAIILIVIALRGLLKGSISLGMQYALWGIVLIRLLVPVSLFQSDLSVANLLEPVRQLAGQGSAVTVEAYENAYQTAAQHYQEQGIDASRDQLRQEAREQVYQDSYSEIAGTYIQSGISVSDAQIRSEAQSHADLISIQAMASDSLFFVWIGGMGLAACVLLVSNIRFGMQLRGSATPLEIETVPLKVYLSDCVATPCLYGFPKPAIYLTREVMSDNRMRGHVLAHEMSHYRQMDHIWSVLRCICLVLHWYNPLVWAAAILSRRDAELACDEATIRRLGEEQRTAYGRTLVSMTCVRRDPGSLLLTATTMLGNKKTLKERITLIAARPRTTLYALIGCILIVTLAVGCTFTGANTEPTEPTKVEDVVWDKLRDAVAAENGAEGRHLSLCMSPDAPDKADFANLSKANEIWIYDGDYYVEAFTDGYGAAYILFEDGTLYVHMTGDQWFVSDDSDAAEDYRIDLPSRSSYTMTWDQTEAYLDVIFQKIDDDPRRAATVIYRMDSNGALLWVCESVSGYLVGTDGERTENVFYAYLMFHDTALSDVQQKVASSANDILEDMVVFDPDSLTTEPVEHPGTPIDSDE